MGTSLAESHLIARTRKKDPLLSHIKSTTIFQKNWQQKFTSYASTDLKSTTIVFHDFHAYRSYFSKVKCAWFHFKVLQHFDVISTIYKSVDNEHLMLVMFYRQLYAYMTEKQYCAIIFSVLFVCSLIRAANNSQSLDNVQLTKPSLLLDMMTRQIKYQRLSPCSWRFAHRAQRSYCDLDYG